MKEQEYHLNAGNSPQSMCYKYAANADSNTLELKQIEIPQRLGCISKMLLPGKIHVPQTG